jgi:diguanylate cyclase (GGDEF)-like protein
MSATSRTTADAGPGTETPLPAFHPVNTVEDWNASDRDRDRRLEALSRIGVLERIGDPVLTALTRLAQDVTGASSAAVHIFDDEYQRRIAASGAPLGDHPAQDSMCRMVITSGTRLITSDATKAESLRYSSYVRNAMTPVRFYASLPMTVDGGVAVGTLCAFDTETHELTDQQVARLQDIAELARAHLELMRIASDLGEAATRDPLTGALNRVIFDDRLAQTLARVRRRGLPALVAVIDLDNFKDLNDTHGHATGDAALRWVAQRLKQCVRDEDSIGRLGGDEFGLVADVSVGNPHALLSRIQGAPAGFDPPFTLSVGAVLAEDIDDVRSVLERADAAMYTVKRSRKASR